MRYQGKEYGLMLYDKNDMPVAYFDEYADVATYLKTSINSLQCSVSRGGKTRGGHVVYRVPLDGE